MIEPEITRDYYEEALLIIAEKTMLLPERAHLVALFNVINQMVDAHALIGQFQGGANDR